MAAWWGVADLLAFYTTAKAHSLPWTVRDGRARGGVHLLGGDPGHRNRGLEWLELRLEIATRGERERSHRIKKERCNDGNPMVLH